MMAKFFVGLLPAKYGWLHMGDSIKFSHSFRVSREKK